MSRKFAILELLAIAAMAAGLTPALAEEIDASLIGAWATSSAECERLFESRDGAPPYRQPVDKFAQAAIISAREILLPASTCRLKSASRDGDTVKLSAECNDSVSYTSQNTAIKIQSATEIVYSPTGDPTLATTFVKCAR